MAFGASWTYLITNRGNDAIADFIPWYVCLSHVVLGMINNVFLQDYCCKRFQQSTLVNDVDQVTMYQVTVALTVCHQDCFSSSERR